VGLASFTVLVWDHIITFSDEVEYIWKRPKGLGEFTLWLLHVIGLRNLDSLKLPTSFSWLAPQLDPSLCSHFVRYEGAMTMIGITIVALMMFLRIRVLYQGIWEVQAVVLAILFTFIGVNSWLITRGIPVYHPAYPLVDSCTMIIDPKVGPIASSTAWLPLLYDTVVVTLTLKRTVSYLDSSNPGHIFRVLLREGLLYYSVICTITLTFTIMIVSTTQSIRNVTGQ
ncbi:hypothetical protein BGW80DRAFT_1177705, partial [Lactifluus volemus]